MSQKGNALFSLTTEMTPKIDEKDVAFSLRSRDYKDAQCVEYRKTAHPRTADEGQGYEGTEVSDTLNAFDNTETRTPLLVLNDQGGSQMSVSEDVSLTMRAQEHGHQPLICDTAYRGFDCYNLQDTGEIGRCIATNSGGLNEHIPVVYENHSQDTRYRNLGDVCQTVTAAWGTGGNNQPLVVKEVYDAQRRHDYQPFGDVCETIQARYGTGGNNIPMVRDAVVRRLTPTECERLQGYPDGWTDIGEWTDTKGKKHKPADSPRYKALGNSIALPFWEWLAKRIVKQLKKDGVEKPTMASLFDGIGGFPLVFQRAGAEPVWASEIEEFPIAVTKRRFPNAEDAETHT